MKPLIVLCVEKIARAIGEGFEVYVAEALSSILTTADAYAVDEDTTSNEEDDDNLLHCSTFEAFSIITRQVKTKEILPLYKCVVKLIELVFKGKIVSCHGKELKKKKGNNEDDKGREGQGCLSKGARKEGIEEGCAAFVLFHDDSFGNKSHRIKKNAIPNKTLKGFNIVDLLKEELERVFLVMDSEVGLTTHVIQYVSHKSLDNLGSTKSCHAWLVLERLTQWPSLFTSCSVLVQPESPTLNS